MNNQYLLGLLSAKIANLFTSNDYDVIKELPLDKVINYLSSVGINDSILADDQDIIFNLNNSLAKEVQSYISVDHPIYCYFFGQEKKDVVYINKLSSKLFKIDSIFSKYHGIKNIILALRLSKLNRDFEDVRLNLLSQNEYSIDLLEQYFHLGFVNLINFTKELYNLNLNENDEMTNIEHQLETYFYNLVSSCAYSDQYEVILIYYIFMRQKQIYNISSVIYLGDIYYE